VSTLVTALLVLEGAGLEGDTAGATDATVVRAKLERLLPGSLRRRAVATATATHVLMSGLEPVDARLHGLLVDTAAQRGIVHFAVPTATAVSAIDRCNRSFSSSARAAGTSSAMTCTVAAGAFPA